MLRLKLEVSSLTALRESIEQKMLSSARGIAATWAEVAQSSGAPKAYIQGAKDAIIETTESVDEGEQIKVTVQITNAMKGSKFVDTGNREYRLPLVYHWPTPKTRFTRDGQMYLIIPLPLKTATVPAHVQTRARALRRAGKKLRGFEYPYSGLFRATAGWGIFRTMRPNSPGWTVKAREGLRIVEKVAEIVGGEPSKAVGDSL